MTEERDTRPWLTISHYGPDKKEWTNQWLQNPEDFSEEDREFVKAFLKKAWFSGKDDRGQYMNINGFVSKEEREGNQVQPSKW